MNFILAELPNGIAPPVHLFNWQYNQDVRNWILLPILLLILFWLYRYFKSMQKEIPKRKPRIPLLPTEALKEKIEIIEKNYSSNFMYREGLHELSLIMRTYFESKTGVEIEEMTVEEISKKVKDKKVVNFFSNLSSLQFGKNNPIKSEFDEAFADARVASGIEHTTKTKVKVKSSGIVRAKN